MYKADITFTHDGASCNRSKNTLVYLDHKKVCLVYDWSSQYSDLNPLKNLWAILKNNHSRDNSGKKELWDLIYDEWYKIPDDIIRSLYKSLPQSICHKVEGCSF